MRNREPLLHPRPLFGRGWADLAFARFAEGLAPPVLSLLKGYEDQRRNLMLMIPLAQFCNLQHRFPPKRMGSPRLSSPQDQAAGNHVVDSLLSFREAGKDVPNEQWDEVCDEFRKVTA